MTARQSIGRTIVLGMTSKRFLDRTVVSCQSCIFLLILIFYPTYILNQILLFSNTHFMNFPNTYILYHDLYAYQMKTFFPHLPHPSTHPWRNRFETNTRCFTIEKNWAVICSISRVLHGDRRAKFGSIIIWLNFIYTLNDIVSQCIRSRCKGHDLVSFKQMFF